MAKRYMEDDFEYSIHTHTHLAKCESVLIQQIAHLSSTRYTRYFMNNLSFFVVVHKNYLSFSLTTNKKVFRSVGSGRTLLIVSVWPSKDKLDSLGKKTFVFIYSQFPFLQISTKASIIWPDLPKKKTCC